MDLSLIAKHRTRSAMDLSLIALILVITEAAGQFPYMDSFMGGGMGSRNAPEQNDINTKPGPSAGTMGTKPASAMQIGTGSSGPGDYGGNYKAPNYTQYTQQDFKDFMPDYQEMMKSSMGGSSSYSNFSSFNEMFKGFMELQKDQLKMEEAKADANKAKVSLAMDYPQDEIEEKFKDFETVKSKREDAYDGEHEVEVENQYRRLVRGLTEFMQQQPVHGAVSVGGIPYPEDEITDHIPDVSFSLNPMRKRPPPSNAAPAKAMPMPMPMQPMTPIQMLRPESPTRLGSSYPKEDTESASPYPKEEIAELIPDILFSLKPAKPKQTMKPIMKAKPLMNPKLKPMMKPLVASAIHHELSGLRQPMRLQKMLIPALEVVLVIYEVDRPRDSSPGRLVATKNLYTVPMMGPLRRLHRRKREEPITDHLGSGGLVDQTGSGAKPKPMMKAMMKAKPMMNPKTMITDHTGSGGLVDQMGSGSLVDHPDSSGTSYGAFEKPLVDGSGGLPHGGFEKPFGDLKHAAFENPSVAKRMVHVDLTQTGSGSLPYGAIEEVSAGGGRNPGGHEGGGLSAKIWIPPQQILTEANLFEDDTI